jgi:hypothetical protein
MIPFAFLMLASLALAGCHTTDPGRSVGWPTPQRSASPLQH